MPTVHVYVRGRVQGVFYRHCTREKASSLGLAGWVRNLDDGRVELEASGAKEGLDALVLWCHSGPPSAVVDHVDATWAEDDGAPKHASGFQVRD